MGRAAEQLRRAGAPFSVKVVRKADRLDVLEHTREERPSSPTRPWRHLGILISVKRGGR